MTRLARCAALFAVLLSCACASTKALIEVDLYKEDPNHKTRLTPERAQEMLAALDELGAAGEQNVRDRVELSAAIFEVYSNVWIFTSGTSDGLDVFERQFKEHQQMLNDRLSGTGLSFAINSAKESLNDYLAATREVVRTRDARVPDPRLREERLRRLEDDALDRVSSAGAVYKAVTGPVDSVFEQAEYWDDVTVNLRNTATWFQSKRDPTPTPKAAVDQIERSLKELKAKVEAVETRYPGIRVPPDPAVDRWLMIVQAKESAKTLAQSLAALPQTGPVSDAESLLITGQEQRMSQIDRIQDPGDPIWRIVTDPAYEKNWNEEFSETYFWAEGNSSVVIVRESPMHFRVQRGTNNPAALVRGQLEIARTVTEAAITVAAAAYGVPPGALPGLTPGSDPNATAPQTPGDSDAVKRGEDFARRSARAQETSYHRTMALDNLERTLRLELSHLTGIEPGTDAYTAELRRLRQVLDGKAKFFAPVSQRSSSSPTAEPE